MRCRKVNSSPRFTNAILFSDDENYLEGAEAVVSGWGSTIEKGPASSIPMKVS